MKQSTSLPNSDRILKVIYKYPLDVFDTPGSREIEVNCISIKPLSVNEQNGSLMLWAVAEISLEKDKNCLHSLIVDVVGTGFPLYEEVNASKVFLGTVVMRSTPFVWHVFSDSSGILL